MISIDINRARELVKDKVREFRKPILESLDTQFMRALENGDDVAKQEAINKKQELRELTKHDDLINAKTPEQLLEFMKTQGIIQDVTTS